VLLNVAFVLAVAGALLLLADVLLSESHKEWISSQLRKSVSWSERRHSMLIEFIQPLYQETSWSKWTIAKTIVIPVVALTVSGFVSYNWRYALGVVLAPKHTLPEVVYPNDTVLALLFGLCIFAAAIATVAVVLWSFLIVIVLIWYGAVLLMLAAMYLLSRVATYQKGPLAAIAAIVAGTIALVKAFTG
jgi:hypothetical protein